MAKELIALNNERKSMTEQETQKAIELVENTGLLKDRVLVIYLKDCHESIAGIIAGRIKERYYRLHLLLLMLRTGQKAQDVQSKAIICTKRLINVKMFSLNMVDILWRLVYH